MDEARFDDMVRTLGEWRTRRGALRALAAAMAALAVRDAGEAAAKRCKSHADCPDCNRCNPRTKRCARGCPKGKQCCGGECVDPKECCTVSADCGPCERCEIGRCRPNPAKNGQKCKGCLECANGACGVPNDDFCPDDHKCVAGSGGCCRRCLDGKCCPPGSACIDPGPFSSNSCCDTRLNTPCGKNGDGTFDECCNNRTEVCRNGSCVPKGECPGGEDPCGERCCGFGEKCSDSGCCYTLDGHKAVCNGKCIDTDVDPNNCGDCGIKCGPCERCFDGRCKSVCTFSQECCGGTCVPFGSCCRGVACDPRTQGCSPQGQCVDYCTLNEPPYTVPCDDGVRHWCCPTRSPVCCERGGQPYCC